MVEQLSLAGLTQAQAYGLVDAVMDAEGLALTASAHERPGSSEWVFEAACEGQPDSEAFQALARTVLGHEVSFVGEKLDPGVNWVARSLEGLKPVIAGGFFVHGSHETGAPPAGLVPIRIDAAQAFGTGHHETTALCLEAIATELRRTSPRSMLDVGTGTGVLAIALARRTRRRVLASDIDPIAITTTRQNARDNGQALRIVAIEAAGLGGQEIRRAAPFDLIVANILAGPLVGLARDMTAVAEPGAIVILSGILDRQAARVINAYRRVGMVLRHRHRRGDWVALVLEHRRR